MGRCSCLNCFCVIIIIDKIRFVNSFVFLQKYKMCRKKNFVEIKKTEADSKTDTDSDSSSSSSESISQDDALSQAKDYYGSDAEYSYKKKVTVGDKEYYDFSVKGDDISSTDVLVSVDGQDVIGGTQNDDGSWSFDQ